MHQRQSTPGSMSGAPELPEVWRNTLNAGKPSASESRWEISHERRGIVGSKSKTSELPGIFGNVLKKNASAGALRWQTPQGEALVCVRKTSSASRITGLHANITDKRLQLLNRLADLQQGQYRDLRYRDAPSCGTFKRQVESLPESFILLGRPASSHLKLTSAREEERRIDPMLDGRVVTYAEMCHGLAEQKLSEKQLRSHWSSLLSAKDLGSSGKMPSREDGAPCNGYCYPPQGEGCDACQVLRSKEDIGNSCKTSDSHISHENAVGSVVTPPMELISNLVSGFQGDCFGDCESAPEPGEIPVNTHHVSNVTDTQELGASQACAQTLVDQSRSPPVDSADGAVTGEAAPCPILGEVEVVFLGGQSFTVPVRSGQSMSCVKTEVRYIRPVPTGMLLQLLHPDGVIQGNENAADFAGTSLTALFTRLPLTDEARALLRRCTLRCPEDAGIDLLEVRFDLKRDDIEDFVELLLQVQPRRLLVENLSRSALSTLATSLKSCLEVEVLHVKTCKESLEDVARLLRWCRTLRHCRLINTGLTAVDVQDLRSEIKASIVI